jgi:hypothetical protein
MIVRTMQWDTDAGRWQQAASRFVPDGATVDLRAEAADYLTTALAPHSYPDVAVGPERPVRVELRRLHDIVDSVETYDPCWACVAGGIRPEHAPVLDGSFSGPYPGRMDHRLALTEQEMLAARDRTRAGS